MIIAKMVFKLGGIHHQNQILRSHFRKLHQCQRYQCYQCQCCSLSAGDLVICSSIDINDECNKCNKHAEVMHRSCMSKVFFPFFCWHLNWYIIYLRFNTECLASYIYLSISASDDGTWKLLIGSSPSGFITLLSIYSDLVCARPQSGCFILSPHETFIIVMMMMLYFTGLWGHHSLLPAWLWQVPTTLLKGWKKTDQTDESSLGWKW